MVPPYLAKPLVNDVLFPLQNGAIVSQTFIYRLLGGLGGSALLAFWILGWARTYVLAASPANRLKLRFAQRDLFSFAKALARVLWWQTYGRFDFTHQQRH